MYSMYMCYVLYAIEIKMLKLCFALLSNMRVELTGKIMDIA